MDHLHNMYIRTYVRTLKEQKFKPSNQTLASVSKKGVQENVFKDMYDQDSR